MSDADYGPAPNLAAEGMRFLTASGGAGRVLVFDSSAALERTAAFYEQRGQQDPSASSWVLVNANVLVQIDHGLSSVEAQRFETALRGLGPPSPSTTPPSTTRAPRGRGRHVRTIRRAVLVVVLVGGGLALARSGRDTAEDPAPIRTASPEAVALVEGTLTPAGERHYYGANPVILDKAAFDAACPNNREHTLVLGCYHLGRISILRVDRPELSTVMRVTAAHEMLHAAYAALSEKDRLRLDGLLEEAYSRLDDQDTRRVVDEYGRRNPQQRASEIHSIVATEARVLSPALEAYYREYFLTRARVVEDNERYRSVFKGLERQIAGLEAQLGELRPQLDRLDETLSARRDEITSLNQRLETLEAQGNIGAYNALIPRQNALVDEYNGLVHHRQELASRYNRMIDEVSGLASEYNGLHSGLESRTPVVPPAVAAGRHPRPSCRAPFDEFRRAKRLYVQKSANARSPPRAARRSVD